MQNQWPTTDNNEVLRPQSVSAWLGWKETIWASISPILDWRRHVSRFIRIARLYQPIFSDGTQAHPLHSRPLRSIAAPQQKKNVPNKPTKKDIPNVTKKTDILNYEQLDCIVDLTQNSVHISLGLFSTNGFAWCSADHSIFDPLLLIIHASKVTLQKKVN